MTFVHSTMLVVSNSIHHKIDPPPPSGDGSALLFPQMHPDTPMAARSAQIAAPGKGYRLPDARMFPFGGVGTGVTTCVAGAFRYCEGTSFATPVVAGAAALVFANNPALTALEVRNRILDTASVPRIGPDAPPALDRVEGGRLLDVAAAVGP